MSTKLSTYLKQLKAESSRFERTDINGLEDKSFKAKYYLKIIFAAVSIGLTLLLEVGFSEGFTSFIASVLSILVGLFITSLVFSFDKFYKPINMPNPTSRDIVLDKQGHNYVKKFAYTTSYTIVLSVCTLVFISASALFEKQMQLNVYNLSFCIECLKSLNFPDIILFFQAIFVLIQRFLVLYWFIRIMHNTLYIVSSMVQYMIIQISKK
jgi:hypothetical protein